MVVASKQMRLCMSLLTLPQPPSVSECGEAPGGRGEPSDSVRGKEDKSVGLDGETRGREVAERGG